MIALSVCKQAWEEIAYTSFCLIESKQKHLEFNYESYPREPELPVIKKFTEDLRQMGVLTEEEIKTRVEDFEKSTLRNQCDWKLDRVQALRAFCDYDDNKTMKVSQVLTATLKNAFIKSVNSIDSPFLLKNNKPFIPLEDNAELVSAPVILTKEDDGSITIITKLEILGLKWIKSGRKKIKLDGNRSYFKATVGIRLDANNQWLPYDEGAYDYKLIVPSQS